MRIREGLLAGRFEVVSSPLEVLLEGGGRRFDGFNLSDIFEYMSEENTALLLERIVAASNPGVRLGYWNMLAPRWRPEGMAGCLRSLREEAEELFLMDRAFFYSRFVLEEVVG